eukprot:6886484-Ditylum_brightwellii.AAC.1
MEISTPDNGTHPDAEYKDQFAWDGDVQEPTANPMEDTAMEQAKEVGGERKAKESDRASSKSSKRGVILNVTYNSATDITEQI